MARWARWKDGRDRRRDGKTDETDQPDRRMSWSDGATADREMRWLDRLFRRRIKGRTDKERTGGRIEERKTDCIGLHVGPTIHTHILAGCCMASPFSTSVTVVGCLQHGAGVVRRVTGTPLLCGT